MSLLAELKRRNVFKVGAAYLVVGWVIIEVASTIAPQLNLPEWAPRLVTFLILLGFPIALVLAWIFDMTPDGVQVTEGRTGSGAFYGVVALIAAASIGGYFLLGGERTTAPAETETDGSSSIAVLPFVNMSTDAENEYFADGISEELLNILAGIDGLDVASRTSAFSFKGKDTSIPEIARLLGVRHVLEGSVRRQGTRVRITAQLIDAERDVHLWSETYDRDLTDIFVVQEEIAQAITDALQDILGTRQVTVQASTGNLEAYERFLSARARFYGRENIEQTLTDLREIVALDPQLTDAWAFMAAAAFVNMTINLQRTHDDATLQDWINEGVERALAADPQHSLALATRGANAFGLGDVAGAQQALARAAANERTDSTAHLWSGIHLLLVGKPNAALPYFQEAYRRDPVVTINLGYLAIINIMTGRRAEALQVGRQVLASGGGNAVWMLATEFALAGEADLAVEFIAYALRAASDLSVTQQAATVAAYAAALEDPTRREAFMTEYAPGDLTAIFQIVFEDPAYLDFLHSEDMQYVQTLVAWLPSATWLREHPEFFRFMESIGVAKYWAEAGYPEGCTLADGSGEPHLDCGGAD